MSNKELLKEMWPVLGLLLVALGMVVYMIQQSFFPIPDFNQGDCIARVYEAGEFTPREISRSFRRIEKVGKYNYLTTGHFRYADGDVRSDFEEFSEVSIVYSEEDYTQVDCKTGLEL